MARKVRVQYSCAIYPEVGALASADPTVFEMSNGNTTGFYAQVSVRGPNDKLVKFGNVLQGGPAMVQVCDGCRKQISWLCITRRKAT